MNYEIEIENLHERISKMKNRFWQVALTVGFPLVCLLFAGTWWAYRVGAQTEVNRAAIEEKASAEELEDVKRVTNLTWLAVQKIAVKLDVEIEAPPAVPERAAERRR